MDIQEPLKESMSRFPESIKKRLVAQPLNGSSVITIGDSSSITSRIEIPASVEYPGELELGYSMSLSGAYASTAIPFIPATYVPEIQRIEIQLADATNKFVDLSNAHIYSRMTTSLFNDFKERTVSERVNFLRELGVNRIARSFQAAAETSGFLVDPGAVDIKIPSQQYYNLAGGPEGLLQGSYINIPFLSDSKFSDGYFNDSYTRSDSEGITIPPSSNNQQEYLPLGFFSSTTDLVAGNAAKVYPVQYNFNFKLRDIFHDTFLSNLKCMYHSSNLVIIIYWNPIQQIVFEIPTKVAFGAGILTTNPNKLNIPRAFSGSPVTLQITNLFARYYVETNPSIIAEMKQSTYEIAYPFLYQTSLSLQAGQSGTVGASLIIGNEGESRVYRIYTGLQGSGTVNNFLPSDNFTNIQYKKWNGQVELYVNNDLMQRLVSQFGEWDATMQCFVNSSINTTTELQNLGTIAFHFDTDNKCGKKNEYDDNSLKGMMCDKFININPRFLSVQTDLNTNEQASYTEYIFGVVIRKGIMDKGVFKLA